MNDFRHRRIEFRPLPAGDTPRFPSPGVSQPAYLGRDPRGALHRQARQRAARIQELLLEHTVASKRTPMPSSEPEPATVLASERRAARWDAVRMWALIVLLVAAAACCTQCHLT